MNSTTDERQVEKVVLPVTPEGLAENWPTLFVLIILVAVGLFTATRRR